MGVPWSVQLESCLQDNSDDVRAVAAEALLPLTEALAAEPPGDLQHILWDILLEVEELSPSTGRLPHFSHPKLSQKCLADMICTLCSQLCPVCTKASCCACHQSSDHSHHLMLT